MERFPSKAPTQDIGNGIALTASVTGLSWNEARAGDWNNDGLISAQDLSPLALYFGKKSEVGDPNYYKYAEYIDGNNDGIINEGDVTAIAFHFGESTGGYNIYEADNETGTNAAKVATIPRPSVPDDPENPPLNKSLATLQYDTVAGDIDPSGWVPVEHKWYQVVPFDTSSPPEESTSVKSEWVEIPNEAPVADLRADRTSGIAPLLVNFDGTNSYDPDGSIVLYEFDFTSDGTYDLSNTTGDAQYTYNSEGNHTAALRVTDDRGAAASASVTISVNGWVHTWSRGMNDANGIALDGSGGVYLAGGTYLFGAGSWDGLLLKYDSTGQFQWARTYGGQDADGFNDVACDGSGNLYAVGGVNSFGAGEVDVIIVKYDRDGNIVWAKTWGGGGYDGAQAVAVDGTGNVYVAGTTGSFGAGNVFILKYDGSGNLLWARTWGGTEADYCYAVGVDSSSNVYVAGRTSSFGLVAGDALVLKFDPDGNFLWARTWGPGDGEEAEGIAIDGSGGIYVAGAVLNIAQDNWDVFLLKYSSAGDLLWERWCGGDWTDIAWDVALDLNGNPYLLGTTQGFGTVIQADDLLLLKWDSSGTLEWARTWGDSDLQFGSGGLAFDGTGNLFMAGFAESNNGVWATVTGDWGPLSGTIGTPDGTVGSPSGTETSPAGIEESPVADVDEGGIVILKNYE